MRSGQLRHVVELQRPTLTQNELGEQVTTWTTQHTVWAAVDPLMGRELFDATAAQVEATISHRVTIRYVAGLDSEWRVLFGDRVLEVESIIDPQESKKQLQLMCREVI